MSLWNRIKATLRGHEEETVPEPAAVPARRASHYALVDVEVSPKDQRIVDIGAVRWDGAVLHTDNPRLLMEFLEPVDFIAGHNIVHHDARHLFGDKPVRWGIVDTLYMSPLLFPEQPYHRLVKDDKLLSDQLNNPVNDCEKARHLLMDEMAQWSLLSEEKRAILSGLLQGIREFEGFLEMVGAPRPDGDLAKRIRTYYRGRICQHADLDSLIAKRPDALAYVLALIDTTDHRSITPPWVLHTYPEVEHVMTLLRHRRCQEGCDYCDRELSVHHHLKRIFGYDQFRTYEGEPLQERAARAAVEGKSLLAIFPTGGGKSLTFQLPALMAGRAVHGLTVVISPLQSLMKDQVDNLAERGITDAVSINGLLDPISRSQAIKRVQSGDATLLYIAPEMLRSRTIEKILLARHVVRFVIDEAHCFSSWGQDFRVDYLYIGHFIRHYQEKKQCTRPIPVSCFTATAKQKVIQDICDYFKQTLGVELALFASTAARTNLHYSVIHADTDTEKYARLRALVESTDCPTIVYVSRTKRTKELARKLTADGFKALPFNGKMESDEKIANQEAFMTDRVRIIVATSAFGMGVDKKDVGLVVHYDISDSLENYVQEAGRAGRDPGLEARCFVLYCDNDLNKHFILLNQTKLSINEINQVWRAVKRMTRQRTRVSCSALEIAREAGWSSSTTSDIETRVRTALAALEQAGYLKRGNNSPHVYATGITVKNMDEARARLMKSLLFEKDEVEQAARIIKSLISQKHIAKAQDLEAESRVDYLADILGLTKGEVVSAVERMRQEGILADSKDISAFLQDAGDSQRKTGNLLERFGRLEQFVLEHIPDEGLRISIKQFNDDAQHAGIDTATEKDIRTLLYFLTVKRYIRKQETDGQHLELVRQTGREATLTRLQQRLSVCRYAVEWLYRKATEMTEEEKKRQAVQFSVVELLKDVQEQSRNLFEVQPGIGLEEVEEALLYLSKIGALKLEGGFLVLYNAMDIRRLKDSRTSYKKEDYRMLDEFYKQKIQQVHIVGEYANLMVKDYDAALQYVQDYFHLEYRRFINKYFKGERSKEIELNLTPEKYRQLFNQLSARQMEIISDKESRCIVVAAGPGSGKTRVLVHKLASLLMLEDVKHEQLLMLTFSRAAATEFKQRLMGLIGNAAHFVEIKTFHSYCFDLLGKIGNLDDSKDVVAKAADLINTGGVEPSRIGKTVLVIDEAQDMGADEYALVKALMQANEEMRVIAVGDDDQSIFCFRGADAHYMSQLLTDAGGRLMELTDNYRSTPQVVALANAFVRYIPHRMKSTPIRSMQYEQGQVSVTYHPEGRLMYQPLVDELLAGGGGERRSVCVLTRTNKEAVLLVALLRKSGLRSKLIQSMDGIRFWSLAEVRYFLKQLHKGPRTPLIPDTVWEEAKRQTFATYAGSTALPYLQRCIDLFEQVNTKRYHSDFQEYVFESALEDFSDLAENDIVVSTIHKAKGREFDDVYMLVSDTGLRPDESTLRGYYVGITRAKRRLFIHSNSPLFNRLEADRHQADTRLYPLPDELMLQLSHKDVFLDFFKTRKADILAQRAGRPLCYAGHRLYDASGQKPLVQLSQKMQDELARLEAEGYAVTSASVRFIVSWKPQDADKEEPEYAVLLPDLVLTKTTITSETQTDPS
ncbi:MAG: RecQ family ATP-dependent DNA helicase [Bacteroidaceae bacterium]